jgi:hypothetical protein
MKLELCETVLGVEPIEQIQVYLADSCRRFAAG